VLLNEGLSALPDMVAAGRLVHARLTNWMMVRIAKTYQIVGFTVILFIITGTWVLAPLNLLELLVLVDLTSLAMSTDNVVLSAMPTVWRVTHIAFISTIIGVVSLGEGLSILYIVNAGVQANALQVNGICFQILFWMGLANQYCLRVRGFFWQSMPSAWLGATSLLCAAFVVVTCSVGCDALWLTKTPFWITAAIVAWSFAVQLVLNNVLFVLVLRRFFPSESTVLAHDGPAEASPCLPWVRHRGSRSKRSDDAEVAMV